MEAPKPGKPHGGSPSPAGKTCGAKARSRGGAPCTRPAGWGTNHPGEGRCRNHGGATPVKHGRYSTVKREDIRALIAQHEADPDPLNILPELAAARALFQDFIERYDAWREAILAWHASWGKEDGPQKPREVLDLSDAYRVVSEVTKIVERIEGIRAKNAVSRPELQRIISEMWRVLELNVADDTLRQRIRDGWLGIRL